MNFTYVFFNPNQRLAAWGYCVEVPSRVNYILVYFTVLVINYEVIVIYSSLLGQWSVLSDDSVGRVLLGSVSTADRVCCWNFRGIFKDLWLGFWIFKIYFDTLLKYLSNQSIVCYSLSAEFWQVYFEALLAS